MRRIVSYNYEEYESRGELEIGEGDHRTEGWDVAKRIFDVEGVQHVHTDQYQIYVTIGTAFGWWKDQIESKVIKAIESYLETLSLLDDAGPEEKNKGIT